MAYTQSGGMLNYFAPNIPVATTDAGVLQEIDIGASSADHGELVCFKPCRIKRCLFAVTGETVGGTSAAPTVLFKKRPTPLSATGETTVATLTIPDTTAVGKVIYKDVDVAFGIGDSLEISHTVGTGTPTGMGVAHVECEDSSEVIANMSDVTASA